MGVFSSLASAIIGVQSALGGRGGGLRYLLRDEFTTDRAAGAVTGTAAEPGPGGNRKEGLPANNSIASGQLVSVGGGGLSNYHLYNELPITREAGRIIISRIKSAKDPAVGFATATTVTSVPQLEISIALIVPISAATVLVNAISVELCPITANVYYDVAVIMRSSGAEFFIKGGTEYADWRLIGIHSIGSTGALYAHFLSYTGGGTNYYDYIRVPVAKWLPTPLLSDGFGSAFGTSDGLGHAEGLAGGIGAGGSGVALSNAGGTWSVSGGKAINTPSLGAELLTNGDFSSGTGWTTDTGWSIGSGIATKVASAGASDVYKSGLAVTGTWYRLIWTLLSRTAGDFSPIIGDVGFVTQNVPATYSYTARAVSSTFLGVRGNATSAGTIDNVSAKALTLSELLTLSNLSCADVYAGVAITRGSAYVQAGLALNWDSASSPANGLIAYLNGGNIVVDKCVAGTWTNVSKTAYTYSAGARLVCTMNAGALRTYYNSALVKADTIVDAGILTGQLHGLFSTDASNTLDDLTVYSTGLDGSYNVLDSYAA